MMRPLPFLLSLLVLVPLPVKAEDFKVESALKAATVYTNRATLTRQAEIDVPAGAHKIVFENLPANILTDSIRAEGMAGSSVTLGALTHKRVMTAELTAPREKALNAQLEDLQDQKKLIEADKKALSIKSEFLKNLGKHAGARTNEEIADINLNPEEWAAAAASIHAGLAENFKADLAYDIKIRALDRQIAKVKAELAQLRTGQRYVYEVAVPLESESATKLTIDLSYQVPNASWRPLYDARLDTESGDLALIQYGAVRQNTGEDWTDVALTLSTAQPHRGTDLPPLHPMWVNVWDGSPRPMAKAERRMSAAAPSAVMSMDMAMESADLTRGAGMVMEEKAQFAVAEINTGGFVSEYVIPGPSTVAADGSESKLMIGTFDTENKLQIHVKPQVSTNAILTGRVKLEGEAPILPGQANLFRDGAFVGQSNLPLLRPGEETKLAFGIDDQVSVKRHVMKDERGEKGVLVNKDNVLERHYKTEIENLHSQPVEIVVYETVPVAQDERIKVEILDKVTTNGYETDTDDIKGLLSWTKELAEKDDTVIDLGWKVSWPQDLNLSGL